MENKFAIDGRQIGPGHAPYIIAEMSGNHNQELERAFKIIDAIVDSGADAVKIQTYKPEMITLNVKEGDVNIDHCRTHEAVVTACRSLPEAPVKTMLFFEIASSTEWQPATSAPAFTPNWYVDISEHIDKKIQALKEYDAEMRAFPHPRSYRGLEHLARWRGACVGVEAAEAFMLGRKIVRSF